MTVNYVIVGGGSPPAPTFNYVQGGVAKSYVLTGNPTAISVDAASAWSVTPNPLAGSSSERWESNQPLSGSASDITFIFTFYHQYYLTTQTSPLAGGSVSPSSGWVNSGAAVDIQATENPNYAFSSWTGVGTGSYSGTSNPVTITINGPISETANFVFPLSSLTSVLLNAPAGSVYFVFPDGNTAHRKPTGVGYAQVTDWTALGFVYGSVTNMPQVIALDTNSAYIDQSTGAPKVTNSIIVLFGGPLVNEAVHYYESNRVAPLHWGLLGGFTSGTEYYYNRLGQSVASIPLSVLGPEVQDMALIEAFKDQNGNTVIIFSGFGWQGTFVGGVYFKTVLISQLSTMTDSWYIYHWSDSNGNGFAEVSEVASTPVNHGS